jgi:hypothetical protein
MDKPRSTAAPIIAALLLLLPVLYVGSYLALVEPPQSISSERILQRMFESSGGQISNYRAFQSVSTKLFWPLEQIDRKVRPRAWEIAEPTGTDLSHDRRIPRAPDRRHRQCIKLLRLQGAGRSPEAGSLATIYDRKTAGLSCPCRLDN